MVCAFFIKKLRKKNFKRRIFIFTDNDDAILNPQDKNALIHE